MFDAVKGGKMNKISVVTNDFVLFDRKRRLVKDKVLLVAGGCAPTTFIYGLRPHSAYHLSLVDLG